MRHKMVLIILLLMCCLKTVESKECKETDIIVGRLGKEVELKFLFSLSDLRRRNNTYIIERHGKKIVQNDFQMEDLRKESYILFKKKTESVREKIIYKNGNSTDLAGNLTEIFMTNDTLVVKKTNEQKEDAGIYWIKFRSNVLGQKALIITGKPTIKGRSPPNPVLKPEDNYISTIQLECHSVSTSIGECPLSMYTVWYKYGMKVTDLDHNLTRINLTVDHNGGSFTCLATDYLPCYKRLQTTNHYNVLEIEECNNVTESETFFIKPEYPPIDVKLEPDQREITVIKNEKLKVSCSAECHPECKITWRKYYQDLKLSGFIDFTNNMFENDLVIENVNSSHVGVYSCLVNNTRGHTNKSFTLRFRETGKEALMSAERNNVIVAVTVVIVIVVAVIVIVILVILYKKNRNKGVYKFNQVVFLPRTSRDNNSRNEIPDTSTDNHCRNGIAGTYSGINSRNSEQNMESDGIIYAQLMLLTPNWFRILGTRPEPEVVYSTIDFTKKAPPMPKFMDIDSDEED